MLAAEGVTSFFFSRATLSSLRLQRIVIPYRPKTASSLPAYCYMYESPPTHLRLTSASAISASAYSTSASAYFISASASPMFYSAFPLLSHSSDSFYFYHMLTLLLVKDTYDSGLGVYIVASSHCVSLSFNINFAPNFFFNLSW